MATGHPSTTQNPPPPAPVSRVYLERGTNWVFACAMDWPGWCRRARSADAALEALATYADRYRLVVGPGFSPGELEVIGELAGNRTTDFGAPDARGAWDLAPLEDGEAERLVGLLEACWRRFDTVVAAARAELRKGPRGGGRDRDAVAAHVREAERAYSAKFGARVAPRTVWDHQRATLAAALGAAGPAGAWPLRYVVRRCAWHVLDHAWEIEDRSEDRGTGAATAPER